MADAVDELRALEQRDAELSAFAGRLQALDDEVAVVRGRAESIDAFFAAYPENENRLRKSVAGAETELRHRERELAEAQQEVADARNEEARGAAERLLDRVRSHFSVADARLMRASDALDELERQTSAFTAQLPELTAQAERITRHLPNTDVPNSTPHDLIDWARRAHATLFVAVGQANAQRDRIVREANELATMLLGEPTYGSTTAQVLARVTAAGPRQPQP